MQQYSDDGLKKMVAAYDSQQQGKWDPLAVTKRRSSRRKDSLVATGTQTRAKAGTNGQRKWDWTTWSSDHAALADFINAETSLDITPAQVKACSFLRKPWFSSPEQVDVRETRKRQREEEKAKWSYETKEQRAKRFAANRALKSQSKKLREAQKLLDEVKKLRAEAGLDPETGEPVVAV